MSPLKKHKTVVEKAEEEELPPGWKKELKIRKSGSATKIDKFYTDPVTGYIFHSFKDVQRYLRTGEVGKLASKPKGNDTVNMDNVIEPSGKESIEAEEMSGTWRHKRSLEDESGGRKTRSKLSETVKSESPHRASKRLAGIDNAPLPSPEPKTRQAVRLTSVNIDVSPSSPSESKTRQATRQAGTQIDTPPSSPSDTRISRRVAGVSTDASAPSQPEPKTRQATQQAGIQIEMPPSSPPDTRTSRQATPLSGVSINASAPSPPEPKTRQATRQAGIKIDSPPPSLPDSRTRQTTGHAGMKADASVPSSPDPKTGKDTRLVGIEMVASPQEPKTQQAKQAAGMEIDALYLSLPEPKARKATQQSGTRDDSIPPSLPGSKTCQATRESDINVNASVPSPPEPETRKITRVVGMEIDASSPSLPEPKARKATRLSGVGDDSIPSEPKMRRATRQSGIKIESPPSSPLYTRNSRQTTRRARVAETVKLATPKKIDKKTEVENADMDDKEENSVILPPVSQEKVNKDDFKPNENQESQILLPSDARSTPKEQHREIVMGSAPLQPVSHITMEQQPSLPTVVPQPNFGIQIANKYYEEQKSAVLSAPTSNPMPQYSFGGDMKTESSMNFSLNDLWTDPCIEFAVKTLTGAIPLGDLNKVDNLAASPVEVPMEELWTDPCIEFAVKTLTGAIPIGKDDYSSHQPASSSKPRALHDYTLPDVGANFCQTEVLSQHFETGHNNKQQELVIPTLGNGGLQKPGNKFVGQQVNGSNGQCSRSRFFQ